VSGTVASWVAARTPPPPGALARRIAGALGPQGAAPAADAPEACLDAAERLVRRVLDAGPAAERARETALDLLCADALVTYAFEAAADAPERIGARAAAALSRLAALGAAGGGGPAPNGDAAAAA